MNSPKELVLTTGLTDIFTPTTASLGHSTDGKSFSSPKAKSGIRVGYAIPVGKYCSDKLGWGDCPWPSNRGTSKRDRYRAGYDWGLSSETSTCGKSFRLSGDSVLPPLYSYSVTFPQDAETDIHLFKKMRVKRRVVRSHKNGNIHSGVIHNSQKTGITQWPRADEWLNKTWCVHTMAFDSVIKRNDAPAHATIWMTRRNITLKWKKPDTKTT